MMEESRTYGYDEALAASAEYLGGDLRAAREWADKFAMRDGSGILRERSPRDTLRRIARELARVERKYANPVPEDELFGLLDGFRHVVPDGGAMMYVGNERFCRSLLDSLVAGVEGCGGACGAAVREEADHAVVFWDTLLSESVADCYADLGFRTVSASPRAGVPVCPYDPCRMFHINLYSFVERPFTAEAHFDFDKLRRCVRIAQRMADDLADLEIEQADRILVEIEGSQEPDVVKAAERRLWEKTREMCATGRRTGLGTFAGSDMLAALGLQCGTHEAADFSAYLFKTIAVAAFRSSVEMAKERGAFAIYDAEREKGNPLVMRLKAEDGALYGEMRRHGRRNIDCMVTAPASAAGVAVSAPKAGGGENRQARQAAGYVFAGCRQRVEVSGVEECLDVIRMSEGVNKWAYCPLDIAVSAPGGLDASSLGRVYAEAWRSGCRTAAISRAEDSADGVLETPESEEDTAKAAGAKALAAQTEVVEERPKELECDVVRFQNNKEKWVAFVGLLNGYPYEIFTGLQDDDEGIVLPKTVTRGKIIKSQTADGRHRYDFQFENKRGYKTTVEGLSEKFNPEYWNYAKLISGVLRYRMPIANVVKLVSSLQLQSESINTWKVGVERALKKYIADGTEVKGQRCPNCGEPLVYQNGSLICKNCGESRSV